ncbi:MAG TPA: FkbM family methyltransferase [Caulobacteraceae bacterium]|jgi:FkbM family methyltransferase
MSSGETPFSIVLPTVYGQMIVNRHDTKRTQALISTGRAHDHEEIAMLTTCLKLRGGDGMVVDAGSNVGTHALAFAAAIGPGRPVHAFEPQRLIFNMLAGNVALNAATNIHCHNVALGDRDGRIAAPQFDYTKPLNFGAVEFGGVQREPLEQQPGDDPARREHVPLARLDSFQFGPIALLKIDVEGMEMQLLDGATQTVQRTRPIIYVEYHKSDGAALSARVSAWDYAVYLSALNYLCIPAELAEVIPVQIHSG